LFAALPHNGLALDASSTFPPKPPPLVDLCAALGLRFFYFLGFGETPGKIGV
jgi:hypothetical protein